MVVKWVVSNRLVPPIALWSRLKVTTRKSLVWKCNFFPSKDSFSFRPMDADFGLFADVLCMFLVGFSIYWICPFDLLSHVIFSTLHLARFRSKWKVHVHLLSVLRDNSFLSERTTGHQVSDRITWSPRNRQMLVFFFSEHKHNTFYLIERGFVCIIIIYVVPVVFAWKRVWITK